MSRDDIVPFGEFLDRLDRATAAYEPSNHAEWEGWTRGIMRGEWCLLWQLRELEAHGETDLHTALNMIEAGLLAMKRRRSGRDFRAALGHALDAELAELERGRGEMSIDEEDDHDE